jgi:hypothetical protein
VNRDEKESLEFKCPECGQLMANMGLDFESPRKNDLKAWEHIKNLYSVGITFHSCGCTGPGYIPADKEKLLEYLSERKEDYIENLRFWINRKEPKTKPDIQRDFQSSSEYRWKLPRNLVDKKYHVDNQKAIEYWTERLDTLEKHIKSLSL